MGFFSRFRSTSAQHQPQQRQQQQQQQQDAGPASTRGKAPAATAGPSTVAYTRLEPKTERSTSTPAYLQPQTAAQYDADRRRSSSPVASMASRSGSRMSRWLPGGRNKERNGSIDWSKGHADLVPPQVTAAVPTYGRTEAPRQLYVSTKHANAGRPHGPTPSPTSPISITGSKSTPLLSLAAADGAQRPPQAKRLSSSDWQQEGGIIGKLNFELSTSPPSEVKYPWLSRSPETVAGGAEATNAADTLSAAGAPAPAQSTAASPSISSVLALPQVVPDHSEAAPDRAKEVHTGAQPPPAADQMEVLESPEKSKKWKGKVRSRRSSLVGDLQPEKPQPTGSPTPRKVSLPMGGEAPRMSSSTSGQGESRSPRVPNLRRPSSTLFSLPFHRSASRASLYNDLDTVPVDDGSFQLKGFRHVSGVTDVEGAGGLEGYLSHVKRQSAANLLDEQQDTPAVSTPPASLVASPVSVLPPRRPSASPLSPPAIRPGMSRPPSVAGSLASMDDHMISGPRVSAAAFRRGIRRPSEGPFTPMSDAGHGSPAAVEDEDDLPLAVRFGKDGRRPSIQSLPKAVLDSPAMDRTGLSGTTTAAGQLNSDASVAQLTKPPLEPAPRPTHSRHASASAFIVKSRPTSPEPPKQTPSIHAADAYQPVFHSPPISRSHTPLQAASHTSNSFVASPISLNFSEQSVTSSPGDLPNQSADQAASPPRTAEPLAPPFATRVPIPPPVAPVQVPEPVVLPSDLPNLPLPPDEMPPSPPKTGRRLAPQLDPSMRVSLTSAKRRSAILDEPKRILSGLWAAGGGPAGDTRAEDDREDSFDPALVVNSMKALGEPSPKADERGVRQRTVSGPRSPVEARLAAASAALNSAIALSRPDLASLTTGADAEDSDDHGTERMRSPVSETSTVAADSTPFASSFVRPRRTGRTSAAGSAKAKKASWSSSEDESESEERRKTPDRRRISASREADAAPSPSAKKQEEIPADHDETQSSEEEPLSQLKARASQLNLLLANGSPSKETEARSPPRSISDSNSRTNPSASQITLSPAVADTSSKRPGLPSSRSVSFTDSPSSSKPPPPRLRSQAPSSRADVSPARTSGSLVPGHPIRNLSSSELRSTASPASSRSALTGDSSVLPTTPSEGSIARGSTASGAQVPDAINPNVRASDSNMVPGLSTSTHHDPRRRSMSQTQSGYPSTAAPPMDPAAWYAYMKQQWQAQYMAAAYRASEDEWERQSNASAHPAASSSPPAMPHMPPFPVGPYNMALPPGFQMPMPYGYPSFPGGPMAGLGQPGMPFGGSPPFVPQHLPPPHPAGFPYFSATPQAPFGYMTPSPSMGPSGGGMYSYGTGSQSVFGGDFGPPAFPAGPFAASHGSPGATMSDVAGPSTPARERRLSSQSQSFETSRAHRPGQQRPGHARRKSDLRFEAGSTVHEGDESEHVQSQVSRASAPVPPPRTASFSPPSSPPSSWRRSTTDFRTGGTSMTASASVAGGEDLAATPRAKARTRTYFAS